MNTSFKLNDLFLIAVLIILSLMPLLFNIESNSLTLMKPVLKLKAAEIKIDGKIFKRVDLSVNDTFVIETDGDYNSIKVEDGAIEIVDANCPDKTCVKSGAIKNVGEVLVCVPHQLLITIINSEVEIKKTSHIERSKIAMNTFITLKADGVNASAAVEESFKKIVDLERKIAEDTKKMEDAAGSDEFVQVNPEVYEILKTAQKYSVLTDGAFDITSGVAIKLWNISDNVNNDNPRLPSIEEIEAIKKFVGYRHLQLRDEDCGVKIDLAGVKLDFGGIAKGYGVDLIRQIFEDYNITDGLIDFGTSTIYAIGNKRIGLKNPRQQNEIIKVVEIKNSAISTSGDYINYFIVDGKRYHHIIDPRTCKPVDNGTASVSVIVEGDKEYCAMTADILSTAAFVLGEEESRKLFSEEEYAKFLYIPSSSP